MDWQVQIDLLQFDEFVVEIDVLVFWSSSDEWEDKNRRNKIRNKADKLWFECVGVCVAA